VNPGALSRLAVPASVANINFCIVSFLFQSDYILFYQIPRFVFQINKNEGEVISHIEYYRNNH
jgi:hypothetical protein